MLPSILQACRETVLVNLRSYVAYVHHLNLILTHRGGCGCGIYVQVKRRERIEGALDSALSIKPVGSDWEADAERQMRAIEAAVRRELDEATAAMDAAEPVPTIRHRRYAKAAASEAEAEATERLHAATRGSRNHREVASRLNAQAAEVEAQLASAGPSGQR